MNNKYCAESTSVEVLVPRSNWTKYTKRIVSAQNQSHHMASELYGLICCIFFLKKNGGPCFLYKKMNVNSFNINVNGEYKREKNRDKCFE